MGFGSISKVIRRTLLRIRNGTTATDAQLLERFSSQRDQDAFAEIVRRHGSMVLRACRRVLHHEQNAEDAFQATFVVLARKAGTIARPELLASWLYGVAYRIAMKARSSAYRHAPAADGLGDLNELPEMEPALVGTDSDIRPVLDEELLRLPDKYRVPLVLCYLEGKTQTEVAQTLGCSLRSVERNLSRARALLRQRLARRGLTLAGSALAVLLQQQATGAIPSQPLEELAVREAACAAAGQMGTGASSAVVSALADAAVESWAPARFPRWALAVTGLLTAAVLGGVVIQGFSKARPEQAAAMSSAQASESAVILRMGFTHWDPLERSFVTIFSAPGEKDLRTAAYSADGRILAIGKSNGTVELTTLRHVRGREPGSVAIAGDGTALWIPRRDGLAPRSSAADLPAPVVAMKVHSEFPVTRVAFSPDRRFLASLAGDQARGELTLSDLRALQLGSGPLASVESRTIRTRWTPEEAKLIFTPDSATLVHIVDSREVHLWDVASLTERPLPWSSDCVCLAVSPDGAMLAFLRPNTRELLVCDLATNQSRLLFPLGEAFFTGKSRLSLALAPRAERVAIEYQNKDEVRVFRVDVAARSWTLIPGSGWCDWPGRSLKFSPDGRCLLKEGAHAGQQVQLDFDAAKSARKGQ
jgi:RNA polymerase sigma factor (sigma-70 family)